MNIYLKIMEKSWKIHGIVLVKMCMNPVDSLTDYNEL